MKLTSIRTLAEFERHARRRLPPSVYSFVAGGAGDEAALHGNRTAYDGWAFAPPALVDISRRDMATPLLGRVWAAPFGIAPMGVMALCRHRADLTIARAAHEANIPFVLSGASTTPLEQVLTAAPNAWFQAYIPKAREVVAPLLGRLRAAGVTTLVVTVDVPIAAKRERELRAGFSVPLRPSLKLLGGALSHPRWFAGTALRTLLDGGVPHFENYGAQRGGPIVTGLRDDHRAGRDRLGWDDIAWIRDQWAARLVVKGLLRADDASRAQAIGADAIVVSNHGGRQLDHAIAPLDALPAIRAAAPRMAVLLDGGVRRGTDVLKALTLGADFVFAGRPFLFATAVGGAEGVAHAIALLRQEVDTTMALSGTPALTSMRTDLLVRRVPLMADPAPARRREAMASLAD